MYARVSDVLWGRTTASPWSHAWHTPGSSQSLRRFHGLTFPWRQVRVIKEAVAAGQGVTAEIWRSDAVVPSSHSKSYIP